MSEVVTTEIKNSIAVVSIDSPPVNAISRVVREGVIEAFTQVESDEGVRAVVLICAGRTFIAGADISEFGKVIPGPTLWDMLASIEGSSKLVVAAIHGTALGGGLETAMHCNYRIALKNNPNHSLKALKQGKLANFNYRPKKHLCERVKRLYRWS